MDATDRLIADALQGRPRWPEGTDTQAVLARVRLHGVAALLHASFERGGAQQVPAEVRETLRARALSVAAVDLAVRRELTRLLELMAAARIRPLLIKGTALACTHYAEPGLRQRADTDLLLRASDRDALFTLLAAQGYRRGEDTGAELASAEASFWREDSPLVLDVHWRINNSPLLAGALRFAELDAQAVPLAALGPHARGPGAVHALLLAAIHRAAHHQAPFYAGGVEYRGDRLVWLYDLHLLAPRLTDEDCAALAQLAARHRVAGLCLDALRRAQDAFDTKVPQALLGALERAASPEEPSMVFLRGGRRSLLLAEVRSLPGWGLRWRLLREHVFPPAPYMLRKYATDRRWLLPALYVRRALGWLARA